MNVKSYARLVTRLHGHGGDCPDCGCAEGDEHWPHCDQEVCPACGGQAICCDSDPAVFEFVPNARCPAAAALSDATPTDKPGEGSPNRLPTQRMRKAIELRDSGMIYRLIGEHFGVSRERARILVKVGRRLVACEAAGATP